MRAIHVAKSGCDGEDTALAGGAEYGDVAAHLLGNLLADHQSKSGAAETTRGGAIGLREGTEQLGLLVGRHANTGIGNGNLQAVVVTI
ncbi:hypothetical protein D9M69_611960 [compost metagenome]